MSPPPLFWFRSRRSLRLPTFSLSLPTFLPFPVLIALAKIHKIHTILNALKNSIRFRCVLFYVVMHATQEVLEEFEDWGGDPDPAELLQWLLMRLHEETRWERKVRAFSCALLLLAWLSDRISKFLRRLPYWEGSFATLFYPTCTKAF